MLKITSHSGKIYITSDSIIVTAMGYFIFKTIDGSVGNVSVDHVRLIEPYTKPEVLGEHIS